MTQPIDARLPELRGELAPPCVLGTAALTSLAFAGQDAAAQVAAQADDASRSYDTSLLLQLGFRREEALAMQRAVLARHTVFRVATTRTPSLRLLCVMAPGDLMVNAPIDFITAHLDVQLDLLYVLPDCALPSAIPDHDVALFAVSEADAALQQRLTALYRAWPRPALNDPAHLPLFARERLPGLLAGQPMIAIAPTRRVARDGVAAAVATKDGPCLLRPLGSHAGAGLTRIDTIQDALTYLQNTAVAELYVTPFMDYRSKDGLYRKYRVAFIDGDPFLCHMAASAHWMVHYLNAGMTESAEKRADEAQAMATFDTGFARRHAAAFAALNAAFRLDYYSIDCAETDDGRLLVFEADTGAIIHAMDPPELFPYKRPQMQRVFAAFDAMLRRRAVSRESAPARLRRHG